jgi:hypothetical protein
MYFQFPKTNYDELNEILTPHFSITPDWLW